MPQLPIRSIITSGSNGLVIEAECHLSNGLPAIIIVGLANKAIEEAKERIRSALANSNIPLPRKRITVNLAPADIHKDSTGLDLAIALAILQYSGQITRKLTPQQAVIGELGLDGSLRGVRGIIGKLLIGKREGIHTFFIPRANLSQASLVPDITLVPLDNIQQLYVALNGTDDLCSKSTGRGTAALAPKGIEDAVVDEIRGQEAAKRALTIAAAGGHNVLFTGPPGTGKSMLARALTSLLPKPTVEEMLEITQLHSLISTNYDQLITSRPFRAPHHSASLAAMVGGGGSLRPGEVSLSHHGVLFLDELPEFGRSTIEALREPLENRQITITKLRETAVYPANFVLVATANPCPCGYLGSSKTCECPPHRIVQYRQKLSGPILDRIDLHVGVSEVKHTELLYCRPDKPSDSDLRIQVQQARAAQKTRFGAIAMLNTAMSNRDIAEKANLAPEGKALLDQAGEHLHLSARSYMRTIKIARTIADLDANEAITAAHVAEALRYRPDTQP